MGYYHEIGTYYDTDAADFDARYWENPVLQQIRQSFREEVKRYPAQSILEVGCGTGLDLVHFALTHPDAVIKGIDISNEMVKLTQKRIDQNGCSNATVKKGRVEEIGNLFGDECFDLVYVFFGALNTVEDLKKAAGHLAKSLKPGGILVLSFVNKWYLAGMLLEMAKLNFRRAFARLKPIWGGYSPVKYLPSHCYTPAQIRKSFHGMKLIKIRGYSILQPAWYFTRINNKLGKAGKLLWKADLLLNRTFFRRFGEYILFVFQLSNNTQQD
jgi:ubiquinone/menaquinone biosynthesis C-methylase UbiE